MFAMKIFNIHGYQGTAHNAAYMALTKCGYEVVSLQLDYDAYTPKALYSKLYEEYRQSGCTALVGTSLGGFFAALICIAEHCPTMFINPCLLPFWTIPKLGHRYDKAVREFTELFGNLAQIDREIVSTVVGSEDEVVDTHDYTKALLENERYFVINGGKHSGETLPLEEIIYEYGQQIFTGSNKNE